MGIIKWVTDFVAKDVAGDIIGNVKHQIDETIEDTQERIEKVTKYVIKSLTLLMIFFLGLIFLLVGIANLIDNKFYPLNEGTGLIIVGGSLVLLTLIIKALK